MWSIYAADVSDGSKYYKIVERTKEYIAFASVVEYYFCDFRQPVSNAEVNDDDDVKPIMGIPYSSQIYNDKLDIYTITAVVTGGREIVGYEYVDYMAHIRFIRCDAEYLKNLKFTNAHNRNGKLELTRTSLSNDSTILNIDYRDYKANRERLKVVDKNTTFVHGNYIYRFGCRGLRRPLSDNYDFEIVRDATAIGWGVAMVDSDKYNPNEEILGKIYGYEVNHLENLLAYCDLPYIKFNISHIPDACTYGIIKDAKAQIIDLSGCDYYQTMHILHDMLKIRTLEMFRKSTLVINKRIHDELCDDASVYDNYRNNIKDKKVIESSKDKIELTINKARFMGWRHLIIVVKE